MKFITKSKLHYNDKQTQDTGVTHAYGKKPMNKLQH